MTREQVIEAIHTVLRDHLRNRHLEGFGPQARLNEDLYLDSVLMMELFLELELSFGLAAPDEIITARDLNTVADVAGLFAPDGEPAPASASASVPEPGSVHGEEYVDIKVHCVVSCFCDALKRAGIDHRPFYFGVWDADFAVGEDWTLRYHAPGVTHDFFCRWYHRLYGAEPREWYDRDKGKPENLAVLLDLVERRSDTLNVMAMVDLFHLPERENKFNQNPFPHYLMLETSADPAMFFVSDPDFRWEGEIERDKVVNAFCQPTVGGGYVFDRRELRPARPADLKAYFEACFRPDANPLTDAVGRIVTSHLAGANGRTPADLPAALRELPVISIRKYAYEHGFAFFWRALGLPDDSFLARCDEIEELVQGFKTLHFAILRLGQTGDTPVAATLADEIAGRLERLDRHEHALKAELDAVFRLWCRENGLLCDPPARSIPLSPATEAAR